MTLPSFVLICYILYLDVRQTLPVMIQKDPRPSPALDIGGGGGGELLSRFDWSGLSFAVLTGERAHAVLLPDSNANYS